MSLIARDRSFESLQKRLRTGELRAPDLNDSNRRLYGVPSQIVVREAFIPDREAIVDSYQGDSIIPTWHFHGRQR